MFDQAKYWVDRHEKLRGDPRSVGNLAHSAEQNLAGEIEVQRIVSSAAQLLLPNAARNSVLDLGCGYGRVASQWISAGFHYTGIDVSPVAIADARQREPRGVFMISDLLNWTPSERYGVVSSLYVLVHFVEDEAWHRFLGVALSAVADGGVFVFADHFPNKRQGAVAHATARTLADHQLELNKRGFEFDSTLRGQFLSRTSLKTASQFQFARRT